MKKPPLSPQVQTGIKVVPNYDSAPLFSQYGTFELRIRSEFYCSNDVIVGHVSLPHYREIVKSMFIKGIVKFLHMKTHFMIFF